MRSEFARQLAVFKGGSGVAEIRRKANNWAAATPAETVAVHYELSRAEDGGIHSYSESGVPGYTVRFNGRLETPVVSGDRLVIGGRTLEIVYGSYAGNLGPVDSVEATLR
jgi:hypothetical protein